MRFENSVSFLEKWQICLAVKWDCYLNLQKGYCKFRGRVEISAPFGNSTAQLRRQRRQVPMVKQVPMVNTPMSLPLPMSLETTVMNDRRRLYPKHDTTTSPEGLWRVMIGFPDSIGNLRYGPELSENIAVKPMYAIHLVFASNVSTLNVSRNSTAKRILSAPTH